MFRASSLSLPRFDPFPFCGLRQRFQPTVKYRIPVPYDIWRSPCTEPSASCPEVCFGTTANQGISMDHDILTGKACKCMSTLFNLSLPSIGVSRLAPVATRFLLCLELELPWYAGSVVFLSAPKGTSISYSDTHLRS